MLHLIPEKPAHADFFEVFLAIVGVGGMIERSQEMLYSSVSKEMIVYMAAVLIGPKEVLVIILITAIVVFVSVRKRRR